MIYKHEDGTISTFYQKGETVEYPSDEEVWNLSDTESNEKSKGLNPIEKDEEMEF